MIRILCLRACRQVRDGLLKAARWARPHAGGIARICARLPFSWRLAVRRLLHAIAGRPLLPLPFARSDPHRTWHERAPSPLVSPGINVVGYARGEFGIAETLRAYSRALDESTYPFLIFNLDAGAASRQQDLSMQGHFGDTLRYANNVFFINADQMPIARTVLGSDAFKLRYNIGFWLWELENFPRDWHAAFDLVDEVWTPTAWVRDAIRAATNKPVMRMPMPVDFDIAPSLGRAHFKIPEDDFVFLFSFDFNGFASRKNPEATIAAFRQAFADCTRGVRLLVKSTNGARFPDRLEALERSRADDPRIEIRDGFLARAEMFGLQNAVDCFVSLHRSEGFGLGLAESMFLGKPVIATAYSGNLDFMDQSNSLLVDYRMIRLRDGDYPYWQGQQWADPAVAHAARLMRQLFDNRDLGRRIGTNAAASIRRKYSLAKCGAALSARLGEIDQHQSRG